MLPDELRKLIRDELGIQTDEVVYIKVEYAETSDLKAKLQYLWDDGDHAERFQVVLSMRFVEKVLKDKWALEITIQQFVAAQVRGIAKAKKERGVS